MLKSSTDDCRNLATDFQKYAAPKLGQDLFIGASYQQMHRPSTAFSCSKSN